MSQHTNYYSAPGEPSDETYPQTVPPATNAFLTFVGSVTHHHSIPSYNIRSFTIDLTAYDKSGTGQAIYINYRLFCVIPETSRWKNFKSLPSIGSQVQITGQIIGTYEFQSENNICVAVDVISYLSKNATTSTDPLTTSLTTPLTETPRKRLRRRGEPAIEQTLTKRPRQETSTPSSSQQIGQDLEREDVTILEDSPDTTIKEEDEEEASDTTTPQRNLRGKRGKQKV